MSSSRQSQRRPVHSRALGAVAAVAPGSPAFWSGVSLLIFAAEDDRGWRVGRITSCR